MIQPSHAELQSDIKALMKSLGGVETSIQSIDKRLATIEAKVLASDLLRARLIGMATVSAATLAAAWWAFHSRVEAILGIGK